MGRTITLLIALSLLLLSASQLVLIPITIFFGLFLYSLFKAGFKVEVEDYLFFGLILVSIISGLFAKNKPLALGGTLILWLYYLTFYVARNANLPREGVYWGGVLSVFLLTTFGLVFYLLPNVSVSLKVWNIGFIDIPSPSTFSQNSIVRSASITPGPVLFSSAVLYLLPIVIAWLLEKFENKQWGLWVGTVLVSACVFLVALTSNSRSFILLAPFTAIVLFFLARKYEGIAIFLMPSIVLFIIFWGHVSTTLAERIRLVLEGLDYTSFSNRMDAYKLALEIFKNSPIIGIGLVNFKEYVPHYLGNYVHNVYLSVLLETGILGFSFFTILLGISLYKSVFTLLDKGDIFRLGCFLSIVSYLVHGLFDNTLYVFSLGAMFWLFLGLSYEKTEKKFKHSRV